MFKLLAAFALVIAMFPLRALGSHPNPEEGFITSFDGTQIHYFFFTPEEASDANPVPLILRTHGWGGSGESAIGGLIQKLLDNGYAVLTWDQRGFGRSGGQAEIDSPEWEGKDVAALIDQIGSRSVIKKEAAVDPIIGMTGGPYAGGIQFVAAAIDPRVDAIAPEIAWHTLPEALFPNNVPKVGWDTLLYAVAHSGYGGYVEQQSFGNGDIGTMNPTIHQSFFQTTATNDPSPFYEFFDAHSIRNVVGAVSIPTLVIEGTIDTLFPLNDGAANFGAVQANGVPVKLLLYNSGHTIGSAIPSGSARATTDCAILLWFRNYLGGRGDCPAEQPDRPQIDMTAADPATLVTYQDQSAAWHHAGAWPPTSDGMSFGPTAAGPLVVTPAPTGGGDIAKGNPNFSELSVRVPIGTTGASGRMLIGIPKITGEVSGTGTEAFLFFKLVDAGTGKVLSDQVTPLRVTLDILGPTAFTIDLNGVSHLLGPNETLVLEISTGSLMYSNSRTPAVVNLTVSGFVPGFVPMPIH